MCYCESVVSFLAKYNTFNVVSVGRGKYLSSTVNPIFAEEIYTTSEPCVRYRRIFIHQFNNFVTVKILIYSTTFTEIFVQILIIYLEDIEENKGFVFMKHLVHHL